MSQPDTLHNVMPQPTGDGVDTLYSHTYGQTYHSTYGAWYEAEQVFLRGSGVGNLLASGTPTSVLEIGFGTGLNFLLTAQQAIEARAALHYVALEKLLLPVEILSKLNHASLPGLASLRQQLLDWRATLPPHPNSGRYDWPFSANSRLTLIVGDAANVDIPRLDYQAVYHDAFSPEANPELWTVDFFAKLYSLLGDDGKLATYSVKGTVRRNLQAVGFRVEKRPGPPGKREVLVAHR